MRRIDVFLILLIAGLIYITTEKKFFQRKSSKKTPPAPVHQVDSHFNEGLPEDFSKSNINSYSNREKLLEDLRYREIKLHAVIQNEQEKFRRGEDANDLEKYSELLNKHKKALFEFQKTRQNLIQEYEKVIKEQESSRDKGLR
jgi:hypothetical protein